MRPVFVTDTVRLNVVEGQNLSESSVVLLDVERTSLVIPGMETFEGFAVRLLTLKDVYESPWDMGNSGDIGVRSPFSNHSPHLY